MLHRDSCRRRVPMGMDREHNQFWCGGPTGDRHAVYVANDSGTHVLTDPDDVRLVIEQLDLRGMRERALQTALEQCIPALGAESPKPHVSKASKVRAVCCLVPYNY